MCHQSLCINAVTLIHTYYCRVHILVLLHVLVYSLLVRCMLESGALRVGVKTTYNILLWCTGYWCN